MICHKLDRLLKSATSCHVTLWAFKQTQQGGFESINFQPTDFGFPSSLEQSFPCWTEKKNDPRNGTQEIIELP